ncbi:MAG: CaiB/BaiF CoA-transferase family protein [Acidobacteriota bacterium]
MRLLDLSRYLPGPYATLLLQDLGADVLKVEEPGLGDPTRWVAPDVEGVSTLFAILNAGKRSVTIDLRKPEGRDLLRELARGADVLVESFRPGVMARAGLAYEDLSHENERLVYCAITGYGQAGPRQDRAGHDLNYQALAGILSPGPSGADDAMPALPIADIAGGALPAVIGILGALLARERTGRGQLVDVSMLAGSLALQPYALSRLLGGRSAEEPTELTGALPCYATYRTSDGHRMALAALEPKFWQGFCRAVGRDDLAPRQFDEGPARTEVFAALRAIFAGRTLAAWREIAASHDVCLEPVLALRETGIPETPSPATLRGTRRSPRGAAPALGQHTDDVLASLEVDDAERARLRAGTQ